MRVRFWGTRGSIPVALTAADVRDKLAQALVQASGKVFHSYEEAHAYASSELDFSLTHTFGGHTPCVEIEVPGDEYYVCDMGSGARPFGVHVLARQARKPATVAEPAEEGVPDRAADQVQIREQRRPRHSGSIALDGARGRLSYGAAMAFTGRHLDSDFAAFPARRVTLDAYWLASGRLAYRLRDGLDLHLRVANAFGARYQDVLAYRTEGRSVHGGIRLALGR